MNLREKPRILSATCTSGSAGATRVEPDLPRLDGLEQQVRAAPRVGREALADLVLRPRLHDVHDAAVAERAAELDEPVVDERLHEARVLLPLRLLLERPRAVELRPCLARDDVEGRQLRGWRSRRRVAPDRRPGLFEVGELEERLQLLELLRAQLVQPARLEVAEQPLDRREEVPRGG